jgi:hypothetical protein
MLTQELSKQDSPREGLGEKTLDGTVTAALAGPTGDTQHCAMARHHEYGSNNPATLAEGGCGHMMALHTRTLTNNWVLRSSYRIRSSVHRVDTDQHHSALCLIKSMVSWIWGATSGALCPVACAPVWNIFSLVAPPLMPLPLHDYRRPWRTSACHAAHRRMHEQQSRGALALVRPRICSG